MRCWCLALLIESRDPAIEVDALQVTLPQEDYESRNLLTPISLTQRRSGWLFDQGGFLLLTTRIHARLGNILPPERQYYC